MSDDQVVRIGCPHCQKADDYDPVTASSQIRICEHCNQMFWLGAVWVSSAEEKSLQSAMKALQISISSEHVKMIMNVVLNYYKQGVIHLFQGYFANAVGIFESQTRKRIDTE